MRKMLAAAAILVLGLASVGAQAASVTYYFTGLLGGAGSNVQPGSPFALPPELALGPFPSLTQYTGWLTLDPSAPDANFYDPNVGLYYGSVLSVGLRVKGVDFSFVPAPAYDMYVFPDGSAPGTMIHIDTVSQPSWLAEFGSGHEMAEVHLIYSAAVFGTLPSDAIPTNLYQLNNAWTLSLKVYDSVTNEEVSRSGPLRFITPVPVPASGVLALCGLGALAFVFRRRGKFEPLAPVGAAA